jgi:hypothetical protein
MFGMNDPFGFNSNINSMLNNFMMDPFGHPQQQQQRNNGNSGTGNGHRSNNNNMMMSPFGGSTMSPFERHNQLMQQMNSNPFALMNQMMNFNMSNMGGVGGGGMQQFVSSDPNAQVFSSSSVVSYSNSGDGKPKIYQESTQTRQVPGGIKETRKMVRDSEKGIEKVAVGHHIGDRAHVIERHKVRGGDVEEIVNLENLDDEQVNEFNQEFESKIASQMRSSNHHHNNHRSHHQHLGSNQPFAIEDGRHSKKDKDRKSKSKSKF